MEENPLRKLETFGQSLWLDYIRRDLIASGELQRLIEEDGIRGMTSNPSIFEKAIAESSLYDQDIRDLALEKKDTKTIYETISQRDVQRAADEFRSVYEKTNGAEGYVSLEVNPHLAYDTEGTLTEARRLWAALNRPNVFIKVPATSQGLPAIRQLISEGINVNVTLIFGVPRYRQVAEAYLAGLEARVTQGKPLNHTASVASLFLSRIDTLLDPKLKTYLSSGGKHPEMAKKVLGQVAISSAKEAYQLYLKIYSSPLFLKLTDKGAHVQRLLWASTSNKNPDYSDIKYMEPLIGPDTVTTVPMETINAYRAHGNPELRLEQNMRQARTVLELLPKLGIHIDTATQLLEDEGVKKFIEPFDRLMDSIKRKASGSSMK